MEQLKRIQNIRKVVDILYLVVTLLLHQIAVPEVAFQVLGNDPGGIPSDMVDGHGRPFHRRAPGGASRGRNITHRGRRVRMRDSITSIKCKKGHS